ncbi:Putative C2H2 finger domain-containing protein [[Torrubiella] hemipterigena]|uniref:Putative C2H2 finger domain-containing protein n=1 Tax=[Torrubiella] hemipterigena TaxID=1531966 RepID=A0A0A1SX14_9HYPO|nr:Putative C2H2 finger domain-containing protein [[Torrubiella] hemipterigena]
MGVLSQRTITKTRRKIRDFDQVKADLISSKSLEKFKDSKAAEDLPDLGRNYCVECARWFNAESTLLAHRKGKPHKRRLKQLREELETARIPGGGSSKRSTEASAETATTTDDVTMAS